MINPSGSITINGIDDAELAEILEIKAKHNNNQFGFNPGQLQNQSSGPKNFYAHATFSWVGEPALKIVQEIVAFLLKSGEKAKVSGQ